MDAMGGDRGPEDIVAGALEAAADGIVPVIYGPGAIDTHGLEHVVAEQVIAMDEKPAEAVRAKPYSSLVAACRSIAEGTADAVVSAGNTGAMLAAGLLEIRRLPSVMRPAIAVPIPARDGPSVLLDCGANADARAEHLLQFAYMGAIFAEEILGLPNPEVRLLSIGEEPEKGNQLTLEAHGLLAESGVRFGGNTEGRDLLAGGGNVVVTDGFTGNVALKTLEGTARAVAGAVRGAARSGPLAAAGGLLLSPALKGLRRGMDPNAVGGAVLLGLRGVAVVAHGSSSTEGIANAVRLADRAVRERALERTTEALERAGATRGGLRASRAPGGEG
ncbi:MAG TPA: phosphate acyltransferase PlsX [Candidatus Acidoferrum sp.]|nr:phosphate acyltransferase PlsX [Candidatus Acidoferrum sp.]